MKETEYLEIIKKELSDSSLIDDDCAFLPDDTTKNSGLFITQDSLVENIHFKLSTITPYQLGKKSVNVNLSDLASACAQPLYITISLSLPDSLGREFVREFYKGVNDVCTSCNIKVAGGDLTGADRLYISICAIGKKTSKYNISRKNAKYGDIVVTTGFHGDSAGGLELLNKGIKADNSLIRAHLEPEAQLQKSGILSKAADFDFAMMDTSDGLADALYKISNDSAVSVEIDFDTVPVSKELKKLFPETYKSLVMWGGEDYQLLFCIRPEIYEKLDKKQFFKIGRITKPEGKNVVKIKDGEKLYIINKEVFDQKSFKHFGEK